MKFFAARHGETTWNEEGRILGSTPGTLTEQGKSQAAKLAEHVRTLGSLKVYASDLQRVKETADIITHVCPELTITATDKLRERNFGELERKLFSEVDWEGFWGLPPDEVAYGAESLTAFTRRIANFMVELEEEKESILLLTHIGVMNRLNYLSDPTNFTFVKYPNADATPFDFDKILTTSKILLTS